MEILYTLILFITLPLESLPYSSVSLQYQNLLLMNTEDWHLVSFRLKSYPLVSNLEQYSTTKEGTQSDLQHKTTLKDNTIDLVTCNQ